LRNDIVIIYSRGVLRPSALRHQEVWEWRESAVSTSTCPWQWQSTHQNPSKRFALAFLIGFFMLYGLRIIRNPTWRIPISPIDKGAIYVHVYLVIYAPRAYFLLHAQFTCAIRAVNIVEMRALCIPLWCCALPNSLPYFLLHFH